MKVRLYPPPEGMGFTLNQVNNRANNWQKIKREAPDCAEFFNSINDVFGRPSYADVVIDGELIILRSTLDSDNQR